MFPSLPIGTTRAGRSPLVGPMTASRSAFGINVKVPGMFGGAGLPCPRACPKASIDIPKPIRFARRVPITFFFIVLLHVINERDGGCATSERKHFTLPEWKYNALGSSSIQSSADVYTAGSRKEPCDGFASNVTCQDSRLFNHSSRFPAALSDAVARAILL